MNESQPFCWPCIDWTQNVICGICLLITSKCSTGNMFHYMIYFLQQLSWFYFSFLCFVSRNSNGVMCIISFYKHDLRLVLPASMFLCKASVKLKKAGHGNTEQNNNGDKQVIRRTLSWKVLTSYHKSVVCYPQCWKPVIRESCL